MLKTFSCILLLTLLPLLHCELGVDVSQLFSVQNYTCMKNNGVTFAIARGYCSFGGIDHNAIQSLTNMKAAGLKAGAYMFPCRGKNATAQVNEFLAAVPSNLYDAVWIDVETNPSPGCSWTGHDSASNCQFIVETVRALQNKKVKVGIYASRYMWSSILGSLTTCAEAATGVPLWYAHYDNVPSFSDYQAFGGWKTPTIKQYLGTTSLCGASVDRSWRP